jgi:putative flippase GtrA
VSLACPLCVLSQYCLFLWFVHSASCFNTACVSGLSILCLFSMLHVSLICSFCVLSQYCLCHWYVHYVSSLNTACVWFVHSLSCFKAACVSGLSILCLIPMLLVTGLPIMCLVPILPESLISPLYLLSQYYLCLWFINSESCLNAACASD